MPYELFHNLFPTIADEETRSITIVGDESETGLPAGEYGFCEMFCNERGCDCRRVFFHVVSSFREDPDAVIAWGWESRAFYAKWLRDDDPRMIAELMGPCLNIGSPQSELAEPLLVLVREVLLQDKAYVERIKRHYQLFRSKIDAKPIIIPSSGKRMRRKIKKNRKRK